MSNTKYKIALDQIRSAIATVDDPALEQAVQVLGDSIEAGKIIGSTGVAIGRGIRMVVNQLNLPPEIVAALVDARGELGGLEPGVYHLGTLLADKTRGFVGRQFVFEEIDNFLASAPNGYLTIEADPGYGKSAILAEYVRRTGCIAHFNVRSLGVVSAAQFLESLCSQLIVDMGLPYPTLPEGATRDGAFLVQLLEHAKNKLEPGESLIVAVDALDEVDLSSHPEGHNILYLPNSLPEKVYFVLTRRVVDIPFVTQAHQKILNLMEYQEENRKDIELYLKQSTQRSGLIHWIEKQEGMSVEVFVKALADISEGNFMYLRYVLPEIEDGAYSNAHIDKLPVGLQGYYEDHWRLMGMTTKPLPRIKIRIVYVLCEAQQSVSRKFIAHLASDEHIAVDELTVQGVLDEWRQFLHEQLAPDGRCYSIYHTSFREFLHRKEIVQAAGVTLKQINAQISDSLLRDLFGAS